MKPIIITLALLLSVATTQAQISANEHEIVTYEEYDNICTMEFFGDSTFGFSLAKLKPSVDDLYQSLAGTWHSAANKLTIQLEYTEGVMTDDYAGVSQLRDMSVKHKSFNETYAFHVGSSKKDDINQLNKLFFTAYSNVTRITNKQISVTGYIRVINNRTIELRPIACGKASHDDKLEDETMQNPKVEDNVKIQSAQSNLLGRVPLLFQYEAIILKKQ